MTYETAKQLVLNGMTLSRTSWDSCKVIRAAKESDVEFINFSTEGIIVEDCEKRLCDCKIIIFNPTHEDKVANDWVKVIKMSKGK